MTVEKIRVTAEVLADAMLKNFLDLALRARQDEALLKLCRDAIESGEMFAYFDDVLLPQLQARLGETE